MTDQLQNAQPNIQPDFNFILEQPGHEPPKKHDKKIWIIGGLLVVVVILLGLSVVLRTTNVNQTAQNATPVTAVDSFFSYVKKGDFTQAAKSISSNPDNVGEVPNGIKKAFTFFDVNTCSSQLVSNTQGVGRIKSTCFTKDKKYKLIVTFETTKVKGVDTVVNYKVAAV